MIFLFPFFAIFFSLADAGLRIPASEDCLRACASWAPGYAGYVRVGEDGKIKNKYFLLWGNILYITRV